MTNDPLARDSATPPLFSEPSNPNALTPELLDEWLSYRQRAERAREALLAARASIDDAVNHLQLIDADPREMRRTLSPGMIVDQAHVLRRRVLELVGNTSTLQQQLPAEGGAR